jgi:hypothetical protein
MEQRQLHQTHIETGAAVEIRIARAPIMIGLTTSEALKPRVVWSAE